MQQRHEPAIEAHRSLIAPGTGEPEQRLAFPRKRVRKTGDPADGGDTGIDDGRLERAMSELASEAGGLDENDPQSAARFMRRLYQTAGVMSGSRLTAMTRADAVKPSDQLLAKLGVTRKDIRKLQDMPFTALLSAQADVEAVERSRGEAPRSFAPVIGVSIPTHPYSPSAPATIAVAR